MTTITVLALKLATLPEFNWPVTTGNQVDFTGFAKVRLQIDGTGATFTKSIAAGGTQYQVYPINEINGMQYVAATIVSANAHQ